ncbi:HAD family hydrolase [Bdellovibrio bacteriovorus]|uniref:HAD family hydrolase n=1 Tax=Bdellovibrio bacteriovorus TaxID=959 RepID=UPI003AA88938
MLAKAIFLDIGGIVLEINWRKTVEALGVFDRSQQDQIWSVLGSAKIHLELERGNATPQEFFAFVRSELKLSPEAPLEEAWNQLILGPLPQVDQIFDRYAGRVPLYALSNTNRPHYDYFMKQFPVMKRFDRILTSFELGHRKPDSEIYMAAATEVGLSPSEIVFIDDSPANVDAAGHLGFRSFHSVNSVPATLEILQRQFSI